MAIVLIADDEPNIRRMVGALLSSEGYEVIECPDGKRTLERIGEDEPDVVLLDLMMPGELDGIGTLTRIRASRPDLPVVMMSGRAGLSDAVSAMKLGAVNFLEKPLSPEGVLLAIASAIELRRTRRAARELREELGLTGDLVGRSPEMLRVRDMIERVAASDARVLITGESGTGKELVASAIHEASPRKNRPFIRVNCAAIPRDLVESEMFGHERGAFTGATQTRAGRFELAHTGTLFLDEIGDLSAEAQAKLLRAIESREIQRVGGQRVISIDVRVVAATNQDLQRKVREGSFREDLFYRLNVIPLPLAPLRERAGDVPLLVQHFSVLYHKRTGQPAPEWSDDAMRVLDSYRWPGNVRELANVVERLAILHPATPIRASYVAAVLYADDGEPASTTASNAGMHPVMTGGGEREDASAGLSASLDSYERSVIARALEQSRGNVADAARRLQTDRANLYRRMRRLGLALAMMLTPYAARAQRPDTTARDTTFNLGSLWSTSDERGGLTLTSGKTYNRVEGLPLLFGPVLRKDAGSLSHSLSVLGILRSAHGFHWDSENIGHRVTGEIRFGRRRGIAVGVTSFDVVDAVERWHLPEPDAGLAAFFLARDYLDHFGRHGGRLYASAFAGGNGIVEASLSDERWSSRRARDVLTFLKGSRGWRPNPLVDDGRMHVAELRVGVDSRNVATNPWAGWYVDTRYERAGGELVRALTARAGAPPAFERVTYGRAFFDVRKYNRLSPRHQLNARAVLGGWIHGDELPLQRRFSVGGVGTLPGFDFRRVGIGPDVGQCGPESAPLESRPALCERVALAQVEYRSELRSDLIDMLNRRGIRLRGAVFNVRPAFVAFTDVGRGWLVGAREGILRYPSGTFPSLDTFRTDVGVGLDVGVGGIYVAKAVSESKEPANFFVRLRNRF